MLNSSDVFDFYAPAFLLEELDNHRARLLRLTGYSARDFDFLQLMIFKKIDLIDLESIRPSTFEASIELTRDVDEFDAPFIALALELESPLWTGDKKLIKGLDKKGIDWILTTDIVLKIRDSQ